MNTFFEGVRVAKVDAGISLVDTPTCGWIHPFQHYQWSLIAGCEYWIVVHSIMRASCGPHTSTQIIIVHGNYGRAQNVTIYGYTSNAIVLSGAHPRLVQYDHQSELVSSYHLKHHLRNTKQDLQWLKAGKLLCLSKHPKAIFILVWVYCLKHYYCIGVHYNKSNTALRNWMWFC